MYAIHAALSHTAPVMLTQANRIMVTVYPLFSCPLFSSHLSSAFRSVCLSLSLYHPVTLLVVISLWAKQHLSVLRANRKETLQHSWVASRTDSWKENCETKQMHERKCQTLTNVKHTSLHSPSARIRIQSSKWVCLQSVCCWARLAQSPPLPLCLCLPGRPLKCKHVYLWVCLCLSFYPSITSCRSAAAAVRLQPYSRPSLSPLITIPISLSLSVMDLLAVLPPLWDEI